MKKIPYVDLAAQHAPLKAEILEAVGRVLDHGHFVLGEEVAKFEEALAGYCGTRFAVGLNSGTDALFLALKALGVGPGDEVITVSNSFLATASAIIAVGAKPVFVDIRKDLNIDPTLIEARITPQTRVILPVHLTGKPADMHPILTLAKKHHLKVVEDCAQAIGAIYDGKKVGSLGDVGCFSCHPLKTLNACGDGGAIVTNEKGIYDTILQLRNIGLKNRDESDMWGYNSRLDTFQAAILQVKMKYLEPWTEARRCNARFYSEGLYDLVEVPPGEKPHERAVYHTYVIQADHRDALRKYLEENGIGTRIHYPIPIHLQGSAYGYKQGDLPVTEAAAGRILSLPVYPELSEGGLERVVASIRRFYQSAVS